MSNEKWGDEMGSDESGMRCDGMGRRVMGWGGGVMG